MVEALLFNSHQCLDFSDIRHNVLRIPEVVARMREAQTEWDRISTVGIDLMNFVASENDVYMESVQLKKLLSSIVQAGLWDRYIRKNGNPDFIVGTLNNDSGIQLAMGVRTITELLTEFASPSAEFKADTLPQSFIPRLSGESLKSYALYRKSTENIHGYEAVIESDMNLKGIIQKLVEDFGVTKFTNIGPGSSMLGEFHAEMSMLDVQITESIDQDPMLNWFWPAMRHHMINNTPVVTQ